MTLLSQEQLKSWGKDCFPSHTPKKLRTKMIWPLPPQMCLGLPAYSISHYLLVHQHGLYGYDRYTCWQKWEWMVSVLLGKDWQSFGHRTSNHWSKWLITASHQHTRLYALFRETVSYKHSSLIISKEENQLSV